MHRRSGNIDTRWVVGLVAVAAVVGVIAVLRLDTTGKTGSGLSGAFVYDLSELAKVDPNLILYAESSPPVNTGFGRTHAIALDPGGRIYVAGDSAIRIFSKTSNFERVIELSGEPRCLTVSDDGQIYIGLKDHVEILDAEGQRVATWESLGDAALLTSIAKYKDDVFVADAGHRIVVHYDTAGTLIGRIGEKDADRSIPGFLVPSPYFDLAVTRDGLLRVVNPGRGRIEAYTFDGDLEFWWGTQSTDIKGFCGCCNPVNFALLPNGGFVTAEKGLVRVKVYNSDGGFVGVVAAPAQLTGGRQVRICYRPEECREGGLDVAVGADERVYVLDTIENNIRVFNRKEASP